MTRRTEMIAAKIAFCIYCGGLRTANQELYHANLVGPGHPAEEFPGDPTATKYFGAGAGAFIYYHRGCTPETGEKAQKDEAFIADYNALVAKHGKMVGSCGHCPDRISDVNSGWSTKLVDDEIVYLDEYGLTDGQRSVLRYVREKSPHLLVGTRSFDGLITLGYLDPPPAGGDGHHVLTDKGLRALEKK